MKRFISLITVVCFGLMLAQDAAGTYKLTGTNVRYTSILRQTSTVFATDAYGLGVTLPLITLEAGEAAGQFVNGPFTEQTLTGSGAFLNVTFDELGGGTINEGSYYPTLTLEDCVTVPGSLPITDELSYTSDLTPNTYVQSTTMLGQPSMSPFATHQAFDSEGSLCFPDDPEDDCIPAFYGPGFAGKISLSQSAELDLFVAGQTAGAIGACQAGFYVFGADGTPLEEPVPCCANSVEGFECLPGNDCHVFEACASAGYASKGHTFETVPGNGIRDMYVEWHAIDGPLSQSGFGDFPDPCEDNLCMENIGTPYCTEADGSVSPACTDYADASGIPLENYDRILGVPGIPVTLMNEDCGYGTMIAGGSDLVGPGLAGGVNAACQAGLSGDADANGYPDVVDGCFALDAGGYPDPATAAFIGACQELGFDEVTCSDLAAMAQAAVTSQMICYDYVNHVVVEADEEGCGAGAADGETWAWVNVAWDCYGLLGLTYQSADLCNLAADAWLNLCVVGDGLGRDFHVLDPSLAQWGGFLSWNAVQFGQCATAAVGECAPLCVGDCVPGCMADGTSYDECLGSCTASCVDDCTAEAAAGACSPWAGADGGVLFDPTCLADGDFSDCAGRLNMSMDNLCVPELQVREVYIDFDEIDDCAANGDVTLDDIVNILDVVTLVQIILDDDQELNDNQLCNADVNTDGIANILDVVQIVQMILGTGGRTTDASVIEIFNNDNTITIEADGYVGAVQMTLSHDNDFSIELTNDAFVAKSYTDGNQTKLMVVNPGSELFIADGEFTIEEVIAVNGNDYIDVINPDVISLSDAYPNPFNPTTSFDLKVGTSGHVTMNVYNLMGQNVGTLVNNTMDAGNYNITWDATNFSSGMYIVKAETVNGVATQKVMLVK